MNFTIKYIRAFSLGVTLSIILLATMFQITGTREVEAQTTLPEISRPTFNVGYQTLGVNEKGEEVTVTLIEKTDTTRTWKRSDGCMWSQLKTGFSPSLKWSDCGGTDGEYTIKLVQGNPYPIRLGTSWKYAMDGFNAKGNSWSNWRACKVEGTEKVKVPLGEFDTYKIVCEEQRSTRTYYMSPELNRTVQYTQTGRRNRSWKLKKVVSTGSQ